ncbi:MAG: M56 family metallopeptidase [Chitinophagaceae bacterium]|nr:M56 family metallopeptidase [Chitinophagaceae bacterium]
MIAYLLQVAALIAVGWLLYTALLRRETFFSVNRFLLLLLLLIAFTAPLLIIPRQFSVRAFFQKEIPLLTTYRSAVVSSNPLKNVSKQGGEEDLSVQPTASRHWVQWLLLAYWIGVAILTVNFLIQLAAIVYKRWKLPAIRDGRVIILEEKGDRSPGSFWNLILINPGRYEWEVYEQILAHEKIHVQKRHSIDLMLAELLVVFQWFNPFAWLLHRSIEANLEFQTDSNLLQEGKVEPAVYQLNLLKVAAPNQLLRIQSAYNQSLLQQRIRMMNRQRSNLHSSWKYLALIPLLMLTLSVVNHPAEMEWKNDESGRDISALPIENKSPVYGQRVHAKPDSVSTTRTLKTIILQPHTGDTIAHTPVSVADQFSNQDSNSQSPATIFPPEPENSPVAAAEKKTTSPPATTDLYAGYSLSDIDKLKKAGISTAVLSGYASVGWKNVPADDLVSLYKADVSAAIIQGYQSIGLKDLSAGQLLWLKKKKFSAARIQGFHRVGLQHVSLDSLYYLESNNVSPADVQGILQRGFTEVPVNQFVELEKAGVRPAYIQSFQQLGFTNITLAEAIGLKERGYKANDVSELIKNGFHLTSLSQLLDTKKKRKK